MTRLRVNALQLARLQWSRRTGLCTFAINVTRGLSGRRSSSISWSHLKSMCDQGPSRAQISLVALGPAPNLRPSPDSEHRSALRKSAERFHQPAYRCNATGISLGAHLHGTCGHLLHSNVDKSRKWKCRRPFQRGKKKQNKKTQLLTSPNQPSIVINEQQLGLDKSVPRKMPQLNPVS